MWNFLPHATKLSGRSTQRRSSRSLPQRAASSTKLFHGINSFGAINHCHTTNLSSRYQTASDGSSIVVSIIAPVLLYFTARVFAYMSLVRIAYIVFLCVTLRPLARKYFSAQMDQVYDVVFRFVNAIVSPAPVPARDAVAGGGVQAQASTDKKEM